jgi:lysophospholipase
MDEGNGIPATPAGAVSDGIRHHVAEFDGCDGLPLVWRSWLPEGEAAAVLAVVHGYGEHGGRYTFLVEDMVSRGYGIVTYDLRGHGRSPGRRGHVDRFADYVTDTGAFLAVAGRLQPQAPLFLVGHSMGGLIAAAYIEQVEGKSASPSARGQGGDDAPHPAGLVLSSPFVGMRLRVPPLKVQAARLLSRVAPTLRMDNPLRNEDLSHDPAVVAAAGNDPLCHRVTTTRWAAETFVAQRTTLDAAGRVELPLLVLYADDDPIADPLATEELFRRAASSDKTSRCYTGYYHEIFNEVGRAAVFADLAAWLSARDGRPLGSAPARVPSTPGVPS